MESSSLIIIRQDTGIDSLPDYDTGWPEYKVIKFDNYQTRWVICRLDIYYIVYQIFIEIQNFYLYNLYRTCVQVSK